MAKHIDFADVLMQLPDERIEEALILDSAEALSKVKSSEKVLRARTGNLRLKRWLPVSLGAALCLAVILPLTLGKFGHSRGENYENSEKGDNLMQIANPWVPAETVKEVCDALRVPIFNLPASKAVRNCAVLSFDGSSLSDAEMGDIIFTDGSRLRLRLIGSDAPDASEMDRFGGVYGAALTAAEQRGNVTVYHFKYSDSTFAAWISGGVYYWYEPSDADDLEQMIALLLS